jgi:multiple sugar transport system ATP-binding protein
MVYVTHDQEEAMTLGQRIAVMRGGRVEQIGAPLELFDRPANAFVAGFIGMPAMNLRRVEWRRTADGIRVESPGLAFALSPDTALDGASGTVAIGLRPHELALAPLGDADVSGVIEVVEPLGATTVVHLRVGEELMRVVVPAGERPAIGDRAGLRVQRDRVHVFDAATGARLHP